MRTTRTVGAACVALSLVGLVGCAPTVRCPTVAETRDRCTITRLTRESNLGVLICTSLDRATVTRTDTIPIAEP
jgi:hypothetical protein